MYDAMPMSETIEVRFSPKWVAALVAYMGDPDDDSWAVETWGIHFIPDGEHGAVIVAGSNASCLIIRDPETRMYGDHHGEPITVDFPGEFARACHVEAVRMREVEGDLSEIDLPDWMTPSAVTVLVMGLNRNDPEAPWWIEGAAPAPGYSEEEWNDHPLALAKGRAQVHRSLGKPQNYLRLAETFTPVPMASVPIQTHLIAGLRHVSRWSEIEFSESGLMRATFRAAPEATVLIQRARTADEVAALEAESVTAPREEQ